MAATDTPQIILPQALSNTHAYISNPIILTRLSSYLQTFRRAQLASVSWHYAQETRAAHEIRTCLQLRRTRLRTWPRFCVIVSWCSTRHLLHWVRAFILAAVEASRSCAVLKHDWIRKTFTYILMELKPFDEVTAVGFQTRSCHFQTFQVVAISCADRCIRGEGGARAVRQAAAIHKCGVLPMLLVSADPA